MKFKGKKHGFIKDKGNFITVNEGEKINLPEKFANHPLLEKSITPLVSGLIRNADPSAKGAPIVTS